MKHFATLLLLLASIFACQAANKYDNPDTLFVARDGTCEFRNIGDAVEVCRAFMDYHKVIFVKKGTYKEKLIIPSWLDNIEIVGEDVESTIITYDDHADIRMESSERPMGTFRTYTLKIEGNGITLKNITIENNSARLGQAVALHTEGDCLTFIGCRLLGHQDTVYTGKANTRLYFEGCYIEGTTDFIFGPSTAWFEDCTIKSKSNSYVTAASTPKDVEFGYVFNRCRLIADPNVEKVYLGRPWRPYAYTLFMNCELGKHIVAEGWHNWGKKDNESTARYLEYNNKGEGANTAARVAWSRQLTRKEAAAITKERVFARNDTWSPKQ